MSPEVMTLHILVKGKVQGVGFRGTAKHYAEKLCLKGTVKNLSDGGVEIYIQGLRENLNGFIENLKEDEGIAEIEHIFTEEYPINKIYDQFDILF